MSLFYISQICQPDPTLNRAKGAKAVQIPTSAMFAPILRN